MLGYLVAAAAFVLIGALADRSLVVAILFGVAACAAAALLAATLIPRSDDSGQRLDSPAAGQKPAA